MYWLIFNFTFTDLFLSTAVTETLLTGGSLTFSSSCWDACRSVCPDLIQLWHWATYNPRPCSCSHPHTSSLLHREKGTSTALTGTREGKLISQLVQKQDRKNQTIDITHLCLGSRDQPSRGPAVALTPPLLNSISAASSRLKEVEWLLFSLQEHRIRNH